MFQLSSPLSESDLSTPLNDSGMVLENSLEVVESDAEVDNTFDNTERSKAKYKKPPRPCFFCRKNQTRYKRHVLAKHKTHPLVAPLLDMVPKEVDRYIDKFRREGIRKYNISVLKSGGTSFMRQRISTNNSNKEVPIMCTGCKGFFSKTYKARHQLICPANEGINIMIPMISITESEVIDGYNDEFKELLNTLRLDDVGAYVKKDKIILMIDSKAFNSLRRKRDKIIGAQKTVRAQMRLLTRLYLSFQKTYKNQTLIKLDNPSNNAADLFRREGITVLGDAINNLTESTEENEFNEMAGSVIGQKSGLKINILNLLKLTSKYMIGYYLMMNMDDKSKSVVDFLQVLKLFENEIFGDAYHDLNFRRNVNSRKPVNLPNDDDVQMLMKECIEIMKALDEFEFPAESYADIRAAALTFLIIYNARRGGEPGRLFLFQWQEALRGDWIEKGELPEDIDTDGTLVTFITGKGADHLVSILFPPEVQKAVSYLTNKEVRHLAGVADKNPYVFSSMKNSMGYASGWHCINHILQKLNRKGAINATRNRHRIASILGKLQLSEKEKNLVFKHFGHSKHINENRYQAANGSSQINATGKRLNHIYSVDKPSNNFEKDDGNADDTNFNSARIQKADGRNQSGVKRKKRVILFLFFLFFFYFLCFVLFFHYIEKSNHLTLI